MFNSTFLSTYEIFQCLYVDDGAFPFDIQDSLSKGMNLVFKHYARFGLEMHIGRNGGEFKTECVFFPPPNPSNNVSHWQLEHLPVIRPGA
jgi:hypothetical protein